MLLNRTNSYDLVGKVSLFEEDGLFSFASYLIRLQTDRSKLDPRFLSYFLNTEIGKMKIRKYRTRGVSQSNINANNIRKIEIPLPRIQEQMKLMDEINGLSKVAEKASGSNISNRNLMRSIISSLFAEP